MCTVLLLGQALRCCHCSGWLHIWVYECYVLHCALYEMDFIYILFQEFYVLFCWSVIIIFEKYDFHCLLGVAELNFGVSGYWFSTGNISYCTIILTICWAYWKVAQYIEWIKIGLIFIVQYGKYFIVCGQHCAILLQFLSKGRAVNIFVSE
jgi:hypothetical protein